ncbi:MAG: HNH endonuclease signature motif containing protein [Gemmatimonadota bacterium]
MVPATGTVLDVGRKTRTIPPALRRALESRDRGCRFPGCGFRFTDAHHVRHWADGGKTSLANCILLCRLFRLRNKRHYAALITGSCMRGVGGWHATETGSPTSTIPTGSCATMPAARR